MKSGSNHFGAFTYKKYFSKLIGFHMSTKKVQAFL